MATFSRTLTRVLIGALFVGHGTQKLFGWFGGYGREGTGQYMESLGLSPGSRNATAAGTAEAAGGALLATGFLTPLGAALITGVMATAIRTQHRKTGPWITDQGWEYCAVNIAAVVTIADAGPGPFSLDHVLGTERSGLHWALFALGTGLAGSQLAMTASEAEPAPSGSNGAGPEAQREPEAATA